MMRGQLKIASPIWGSFKGRMIVILLLSSVVPLVMLGGVSYYSFQSFLENKIRNGIQENLDKETNHLDNILKNMNFASQQLALDPVLTDKISRYMSTDDTIQRKDILLDVQNRMALINYTSPHVGIMAIMDGSNMDMLFNSYPISDIGDMNELPLLMEANKVFYHAPHLSKDKYDNKKTFVFSLFRKVMVYESGNSFYVYLESNYDTVKQLFGTQQYGEPVIHLLMDPEGRIVYSENESAYELGAVFNSQGTTGKSNKDLRFVAANEQGWSLAIVLKGTTFKVEVNAWIRKYISVGLISLALSLLLALLAWRTIYRPLHIFRREIELLGDNQFNRQQKLLQLSEFDEVLTRFYRMKARVFDLLHEIEHRERTKRRVEVEKLRYQINPHFIHNTLNTVQVIAKMNKQDEIVRLITYFTRILHYNLGKDGTHVRVREEIANLNDYLALQEIRYHHRFQVQVNVAPETEEVLIPRFLLQPIVENALYHGFRSKDGTIAVDVRTYGTASVLIKVADNGEGMSEEVIASLLATDTTDNKKIGLGIGLRFVHEMLQTYYGEAYGLQIESDLHKGTTISMCIPDRVKEGMDDDSNFVG